MKMIFKTLLFSGFFLMANIINAQSAEMYITDVLKLTVRAGPSNQNERVDVIESGQKVSLLRTDKDWAFIRLPDQKEGWVHHRYLMSSPSSRSALKRLKTKHNNLVLQTAALLEENEKLKGENKDLVNVRNAQQQELAGLKSDFNSLKNESAGFLKLKSAYEETAAKLSTQTGQMKKLQEDLSRIEINNSIVWFISGASVLLIGFLIGLIFRRPRKRSTLR